ncbi:hypothetical protein DUZ99_14560 [Xylanibacillus composti]|uniref:DUF6917 domain-containing protein n=1 Tax=Xylanibacillus composti TaxID=1572762 RepID=A0A8J4M215_9BACL|nr:hypothetical protein [Xylanibacillus composti]MDT9726200.1 hypothetical protein [Xylanibacillus composti]GIQ68046.1 hypothetical protein XYCOK13_08700 [Xylanibacillus composti]
MSPAVKRTVEARFVKLLFHKQEHRGMRLIEHETRCVRSGEIHEIVTTTHREAGSGDPIDRVGFLGFAEMCCGGIIERGDPVEIAGQVIGTVLGFDECHYPNHYNILIAVEETLTADDLGLTVEAGIRFGAQESG